MMRLKLALGIAVAGLGLCASTAHAQSTTGSNEYSFYLGEDLPSDIDNVTEILPVFGGRYGLSTAKMGVVEFGLFNTHAKGVDFTTVEASLRGTLPLAPGIDGLFYGGVDYNWYLPVNQTQRQTATGVHFGAGGLIQFTDGLSGRADLKLMGGPGTSLLLLFGILFK